MEKETNPQQQRRQQQHDELPTQCEDYDTRLKQRDAEIASLKRLLELVTGVVPEDDTDEEARLRQIITRLLAKNDELRRGLSDDKKKDQATIAELRLELGQLKLARDFDPLYREKVGQVEQDTIQCLSMRCAELENKTLLHQPFVIVITDAGTKEELNDCTLLHASFAMRRDIIYAAIDGIPEQAERDRFVELQYELWMGENYLIRDLEIRLLGYKMAHDDFFKKLKGMGGLRQKAQ